MIASMTQCISRAGMLTTDRMLTATHTWKTAKIISTLTLGNVVMGNITR